MKKTYTKPEILFESFSMSTSIAGDCESIVGNASRGTCPVEFGLLKIFLTPAGGCSDTDDVVFEPAGDDGKYNGLCYHVPSGGDNYFNS